MSGLLHTLLEDITRSGIAAKPRLEGNKIVIEIDEVTLRDAVTRGLDPRMSSLVSVRILNGRIIIEVQLV